MRYTINVTQEDIDTARADPRFASCWCPVALAAKRATGRAVWVEASYIQIGLPATPEPIDEWTYTPLRSYPQFSLPREAREFIHLFDNDHAVEPFVFTLSDEDEDEDEDEEL